MRHRLLTPAAAVMLLVPVLLTDSAQAASLSAGEDTVGVRADRPASAGAKIKPVKKIKWKRCPDVPSQQCAGYKVPVDWSKPKGAKYSLALRRLPAQPPKQSKARIKTLFFNPGGPGGSATEAMSLFDQSPLRKKFHIVGWDPRGVPASQPALPGCPIDQSALPETGPFTWTEVATTMAIGANNPECIQATEPLMRSVGTNNVVRDLDQLRQAVRDPKLTYVGYSYGTVIGRLYAMRYPDKIRALLMDGIVMPGNTMDEFAESAVHGTNAAWDYVRGQVSPEILELSNQVSDYLQTATITTARGTVDRWKFWALGLQAGETGNPSGNYTTAVCALAQTAGLPTTACAASQLTLRGDNDPLATLLENLKPRPTEAIRCADYRGRPSVDSVVASFEAAGGAPQTYENIFSRGLMCTGWPTRNLVPATNGKVRTSTPLLFVNSIGDSHTSYWGARRTAGHFAGHRFITVGNGLHGLYGDTASACIRQPVEKYLATRELPKRNRTCAN